MTKNRDRKRLIRARMAATGEPYTLARRAVRGGKPGYLRTDWTRSGWMRLLPIQALSLEIAISTATVHGDRVSLQQATEQNPAARDLPDGLRTELTWTSKDDDPETQVLRSDARRTFEAALHARGLDAPETLEDLAQTLAELGVFDRTEHTHGIEWTTPKVLPDPLDVLPLPQSWIDQEELVRWRTVTSMPAEALMRELHDHGQPEHLDTSIDNLATAHDQDHDGIHDALDGILYRGWAAAVRHDRQLDRRVLADLPDHARFRLELDWTSIDDRFDDAEEDGDVDLSKVRWQTTPWAFYLSVADDSRLDPATVRFAGQLPFRMVKPTGGQFLTSLSHFADSQTMSITKAAEALVELEHAALLSWDYEQQQAVLYEARSQGRRRISSPTEGHTGVAARGDAR